MMFQWMLMPLDQHSDFGLGATGCAYKEAADRLVAGGKFTIGNEHIPTNFLYRHAIELFLKSAIVVLHRGLQLKDGDPASQNQSRKLPSVRVGNKWHPLNRVHAISDLYRNFREIIARERVPLSKKCRTDWSQVPSELDMSIAKISSADEASTLFRYPNPDRPQHDHEKSTFKKIKPDALFEGTGGNPITAFIVLDDDDSIVEAFRRDDAPLKDLVQALRSAAEILNGAHLGLRAQLMDGR